MVVTTEHPVAGEIETIGLPVKFSQTPGGVRRHAPTLGMHTREVLAELGYDAGEITRLMTAGAAIGDDQGA